MPIPRKPVVFDYKDARDYIRDFLSKTRCSQRMLLRNSGIRNSGLLANILSGNRKLTRASGSKLGDGMGLAPREKEYFLGLAELSQSDVAVAKEKTARDLLNMRQGEAPVDYFDNHVNSILWNLLHLIRFDADPGSASDPQKWRDLAGKIWFRVNSSTLRAALRNLIKIGMVTRDANGFWIPTGESFIKPPSPKHNHDFDTLRHFQRKRISLGQEAIRQIASRDREISMLTLSLSKEGFEQVRVIARDVLERVKGISLLDRKEKDVFQVTFQVFPLTRLQTEPLAEVKP